MGDNQPTNTMNIKQFKRDMRLKPIKRMFRTLCFLGGNFLLAGVGVVGFLGLSIGVWAVTS